MSVASGLSELSGQVFGCSLNRVRKGSDAAGATVTVPQNRGQAEPVLVGSIGNEGRCLVLASSVGNEGRCLVPNHAQN